MNLMPWRNADADTKHDVIVMLVIHGLLVTMNLVLYAFGPDAVVDTLEGEAFPTTIRLTQWVSWNIKSHFLSIFLPLAFAILWSDIFLYLSILRRFEKRAAVAWRIATTFALLLPMVFFALAWSLYLIMLVEKLAHYS